MFLNTEILFEVLPKVLGSLGERPFISGKQGEMPNI